MAQRTNLYWERNTFLSENWESAKVAPTEKAIFTVTETADISGQADIVPLRGLAVFDGLSMIIGPVLMAIRSPLLRQEPIKRLEPQIIVLCNNMVLVAIIPVRAISCSGMVPYEE